jgi:hypothetical protein
MQISYITFTSHLKVTFKIQKVIYSSKMIKIKLNVNVQVISSEYFRLRILIKSYLMSSIGCESKAQFITINHRHHGFDLISQVYSFDLNTRLKNERIKLKARQNVKQLS